MSKIEGEVEQMDKRIDKTDKWMGILFAGIMTVGTGLIVCLAKIAFF